MSSIGQPALIYLFNQPTLCQGQSADLKLESPTERHWLNRASPDDGATYPVEVEFFNGTAWVSWGGYGDWDIWRRLKAAHPYHNEEWSKIKEERRGKE